MQGRFRCKGTSRAPCLQSINYSLGGSEVDECSLNEMDSFISSGSGMLPDCSSACFDRGNCFLELVAACDACDRCRSNSASFVVPLFVAVARFTFYAVETR